MVLCLLVADTGVVLDVVFTTETDKSLGASLFYWWDSDVRAPHFEFHTGGMPMGFA